MQNAPELSLLQEESRTLLRQRFSKPYFKSAFTLAEVLITLGIIGIVAAMTLPTLITTVQDKILESQAKKARNIVANGYKLMMAHDEIFKVQDLPFLAKCNEMNNADCVSATHKENFQVLNDTASGLRSDAMPLEYSIIGKSQPSPFQWGNVKYMYRVEDGMVYGVIPSDDYTYFDVIVDVNGKNRPNVATKDLRKYRFSGDGGQTYDVSEELTQVNECSVDNPSGCTTVEQCYSLGAAVLSKYPGATHTDFYDGQCRVFCGTASDTPCF